MKARVAVTILLLSCASASLHAGVAMQLVTSDPSGQEVDRSDIHAQSGMLRIDSREDGSNVSMIFLGNEFLVLDHDRKSYILMDEAMLDEMSSQINGMMKKMEAQLAGLPPEQRAMAEQMMQGQMIGMMGQTAAPIDPPRVEAVGAGQWQSRPCQKYDVYEGGQRTQAICTASLDHIAGSGEMMEAFRGMAAYISKLTESLPMFSEDELQPGDLMDLVDGFPVTRVDYRNGEIVRQERLESLTEIDLDPGLFAAPSDYRREDPFASR